MYSPYCHHCLAAAPTWQTLYEFYFTSNPLPSSPPSERQSSLNSFHPYYNFHFANLDCIAYGSACETHSVQRYPTFVLFKNGELVKSLEGVKTLAELSAFVEEILESIKPGSRPKDGVRLPEVGAKEVDTAAKPDVPAAKDKNAAGGIAAGTKHNEQVAQAAAAASETKATAVADTKATQVIKKPSSPIRTPNPLGTSEPLTAEGFQDRVTTTQDPWFVKFYAPWCHHCRAMAPVWDELGREMKGRLNIGEVNCDLESRLCKDVRLRGYPTILYFKGGERIEYDGLRGLGDFVNFAQKAVDLGDGVKYVDAAAFKELEEKEEVIFIYFYDHATTSEDFAALERLTLSLIGHAVLVKTDSAILADKFKITTWPRLVVSRDGRPTEYEALAPKDMRDFRKVLSWMKSVWLPLVPELTASNSREIMDGKLVVLGILSPARPAEFAAGKREIKQAALDWMDKQATAFQLERQELRDAKQLRIEEAEDRGDQRALRSAKSMRISMDGSDRREVGFAWVDGVFWERWIRTTYGVEVKNGERVVINDEDNKRYWDTTISGSYIGASRTAILETIPKVIISPPKIKPKSTISRMENLFFEVRGAAYSHPFLTLGLLIGAFGGGVWGRGRIKKGKGFAGFGGPGGGFFKIDGKDGLLGGGNPSGKRGRPPKNTAVLGEAVKRRRIGDDFSSSSSTPKVLEALRNAAVSSITPASRPTFTGRSDGGHSAEASQENGTVTAGLKEVWDLSVGDRFQDELLALGQTGKTNGQSSLESRLKTVRYSADELGDTIIITRARQRDRPREPRTTKNGGPNRNEHIGDGPSAMDLLDAEEDEPVGTMSPGDWMQHLDPQGVSATKRKRGRPRKSITNVNTSHLNGHSGNESGIVGGSRSVDPDSVHASGTLVKLSVPDADGETPTKRKRGRPRKASANQSESSFPSLTMNGEMLEFVERPISEETPTKRGRGRPRKVSLPESESPTAPTQENKSPALREEQHPSHMVAHSEERQTIRRPVIHNTLASENQLVGIMTPPRRRGRPRKTVNFEGNEQIEVGRALGFKDILREDVGETAATEHTDSNITHNEDYSGPGGSNPPPIRSGRGRPRKDRFPLSWPPLETSHSIPQNSENVNESDYEDDLAIADAAQLRELPQGPALNQQVEVLKRVLLEKLTGKRAVRLVGLDDEQGKVRQVLEQTVVAGEGNSMLVIGSRGSGKSTLVEKVISKVSTEHGEDFHTVRLNGFIHTDDRLALREIWRQLGVEMEIEDELIGKASNYADILSSLLALLSHPSELSESAPNHTAKSVIFILSEFDLFASHPRQTLLYNLFDVAQGRKAPILVLGLTTKIDVVESLEKRVKSRFSHRHVHLGLPRSLGAFWEICKQALLVDKDDIQTAEEEAALILDQEGVLQIWNSVVEGLGNDTDFKHLLQSIFYTTKGVKDFHVACLLPIFDLSPQSLYLKGQDFIDNTLAPPESKLHILEGLSDLELSLLIAAARLDIILDTDTCNFNMSYDEYTTLASRVKLQSSASGASAVGAGSKIWGREVGLGAWERLAEYNLIIPALGGVAGGNGTRDVGRMGRMFRVDVGLEEIWQSMPSLGAVMTKWCREI
ncbi:hypothetical protein FGG08_002214 [Glutinoglossum americanum]|uniref:Thioredoxin domain-containing protein n=1 Tax=Glutinoglossum americanum TaxID=1670608 RepID=A0A9P8IA18_9PEZI|nr:hypothetical protein FGG08_002214 [Glutinoglossum americanum]